MMDSITALYAGVLALIAVALTRGRGACVSQY
jgi:hypothetical protein